MTPTENPSEQNGALKPIPERSSVASNGTASKEEIRQIVVETLKMVVMERTEFFSGSIPSAAHLEQYGRYRKDLPDRIFKMAERSLASEIADREENRKTAKTLALRGQTWVSVIVLASFGTSLFLAKMGALVPAGIALGVGGTLSWIMWSPLKNRRTPSK